MSKIIPSSVAEVARANTDVLVGYIGQACVLFQISSEVRDVLRDNAAVSYADGVETFVLIHWSPEIRLLKSLGLYTEEKAPLPILAHFTFEDDPMPGDLFELEYEFVVGSEKTNHFAVTDRKIMGQDAQFKAVWVVAPARSWPIV